ncbi:MAG: hypothetical protein OXI67_00840 [Candidatus Poribacteria bacterium]|nr:hypothetical protein [Candidatus Poribacteria bacterium]
MYVKTIQDGVINLAHYPRINVYPDQNSYFLCAFSKPEFYAVEPYDRLVIARFSKREDADYALYHLFKSLDTEKPTWDVNSIILLSDLWYEIKQECKGNDLIRNADVSVTGVNEVTITYEDGFDIEYRSTERESVENKLKDALKLLAPFHIKWIQRESV